MVSRKLFLAVTSKQSFLPAAAVIDSEDMFSR